MRFGVGESQPPEVGTDFRHLPVPDAIAAAFDVLRAELGIPTDDETTPMVDPATLPVDVPDGDVGATEPDEPAEGEPE